MPARSAARVSPFSPLPFAPPRQVQQASFRGAHRHHHDTSGLSATPLPSPVLSAVVTDDAAFAAEALATGAETATPVATLAPLPPLPPGPTLDLPGADSHGRPFYGLIADGVHVHPYAVTIAHATHPAGLVLVTDAMQAMGLPIGRHQLGGLDVDIFDGLADGHYEGLHAVLTGTATLAGAVVPLDACLQNFLAFTDCSLAEGLCAVTLHPARALRLAEELGSLHCGAWADMVLLREEDLHRHHHHYQSQQQQQRQGPDVLLTFLAGELVWRRDDAACATSGAVAVSGP